MIVEQKKQKVMGYLVNLKFATVMSLTFSCLCFLIVFFHSWYGKHPRRFWLARLTYPDGDDTQSMVRVSWLLAWFFALCGSYLWLMTLSMSNTWMELLQLLYGAVLPWIMAKAIVATIIAFQYIGFVIIRLKNWVLYDKPLFPKYEKLRPLKR